MNEIINKFLLVEDKFMTEMHLNALKSRFTYSVNGPFTKNKKRIQKIQDIFIKTK